MRRLVTVLSALVALGLLGGPVNALASSDVGAGEPLPDIQWPPWFDPYILMWLEPLLDGLWPPLVNPPQPVDPCAALAVTSTVAYARCDTQTTEVSDPRAGTSYTAAVTVDVCRHEATGDECVGVSQGLGRTGVEAAPAVRQGNSTVALPQACVGSTCSPSAAVVAPTKVTVFDSGTTPEASVYTPTGAVNANAPQTCVSVDNSCTAGSTHTGTNQAALENVNASQVLTTN